MLSPSSLLVSLLFFLPVPLLSPADTSGPCDTGAPLGAAYELRDASGQLLGHLHLDFSPRTSGGFAFRFEPQDSAGPDAAVVAALLDASQEPYSFLADNANKLELFFVGGLIQIGPPQPLYQPGWPLTNFGPTLSPLLEGFLEVDSGGALVLPFGGTTHVFSLGNPQFDCP